MAKILDYVDLCVDFIFDKIFRVNELEVLKERKVLPECANNNRKSFRKVEKNGEEDLNNDLSYIKEDEVHDLEMSHVSIIPLKSSKYNKGSVSDSEIRDYTNILSSRERRVSRFMEEEMEVKPSETPKFKPRIFKPLENSKKAKIKYKKKTNPVNNNRLNKSMQLGRAKPIAVNEPELSDDEFPNSHNMSALDKLVEETKLNKEKKPQEESVVLLNDVTSFKEVKSNYSNYSNDKALEAKASLPKQNAPSPLKMIMQDNKDKKKRKSSRGNKKNGFGSILENPEYITAFTKRISLK